MAVYSLALNASCTIATFIKNDFGTETTQKMVYEVYPKTYGSISRIENIQSHAWSSPFQINEPCIYGIKRSRLFSTSIFFALNFDYMMASYRIIL
ncbi:hypothetical protein D7Z94_00505 [Ulvibacterium marinum]|uniref:Uncharacterized protein n=1 Tax=Ulvibacterium marinum TaxID=2419782 RepID=A0A3B0CCM2_9FLAO|nr:hypothetical protein D7Z94_00505 [Ulvibacterium marinum]